MTGESRDGLVSRRAIDRGLTTGRPGRAAKVREQIEG